MLLKAKTYEACRTCEAFHNARTGLRGEGEVQEFKAVVLGEAGDGYVMDIGDGQGEVRHAVDCTWEELAADMKKTLEDALESRGLERENVFVYCDATPPCSGVSNMRHPSPEVRGVVLEVHEADRRVRPEDARRGLVRRGHVREYQGVHRSLVVVDGAGTGEAGEAGVLERSVEKKRAEETQREVPRHSLGAMRAGRWQPRGRRGGATRADAEPATTRMA